MCIIHISLSEICISLSHIISTYLHASISGEHTEHEVSAELEASPGFVDRLAVFNHGRRYTRLSRTGVARAPCLPSSPPGSIVDKLAVFNHGRRYTRLSRTGVACAPCLLSSPPGSIVDKLAVFNHGCRYTRLTIQEVDFLYFGMVFQHSIILPFVSCLQEV